MSKRRRGKALKAKKPYQTIYIHKKEPRWGKKSVLASEGMTISEGSYNAARRKTSFGDEGFAYLDDNGYAHSTGAFKDRQPLPRIPTLRELIEKYFNGGLPGPDDFILIDGMKLYYNHRRTEYRFVKEEGNVVQISIRYPNVAMAAMSSKRVVFIETHVLR